MNCRKINSLLSAYMDGELAEGEMEAVREHLTYCTACRLEHETLMRTKRAVASLAYRVSREEIARLLSENESVSAPTRVAQWKVSPVAATVVLSLAGLWLATTSLDSPRDWQQTTAYSDAMPVATSAPMSMTSMVAPFSPTATVTTVSNPVTVYAVTYSGAVLGHTTFREIHLGFSMPHRPSVRKAINRLLGWSSPRPTASPSAPSLIMAGYDNGPVSSGVPMMRTTTERGEAGSSMESLWQEAPSTERYATTSFFH